VSKKYSRRLGAMALLDEKNLMAGRGGLGSE